MIQPTAAARPGHPAANRRPARARWAATVLLAAALAGQSTGLQARAPASQASLGLSMLPMAISVVAPVTVLSAGAALTVVSVNTVAQGSVWVLERASDGARASITLAGGAAAAVGTAVVVSVLSTGWVLSAAGEALCFIPNEVGAALLYNEQVTR